MYHHAYAMILATAALCSAQSTSSTTSITSLLSATSELSTLTASLMKFPDLVSTLGNLTNITIIAPSNTAFQNFQKMPQAASILNDQTMLMNVLTYHVLNGTYASKDFASAPKFLPSILGPFPQFRNISGAPQVLEAALQGSSATLVSGLDQKSTVTKADVAFKGGLVHIVDTVLTPPMNVSSTATALNLTMLVDALTKTNLATTVDQIPGVTVFAPNDAAFMALTSTPSTDALAGVLEYHVVPHVVGYSSLLSNMTLPTVQGSNVTITVVGGNVFVNNVKVLVPNILTNNGVVHVIESVLMPAAGSSSSSSSSSSPSSSGTAGDSMNTSTTTPANASPKVQCRNYSLVAATVMGLLAFSLV